MECSTDGKHGKFRPILKPTRRGKKRKNQKSKKSEYFSVFGTNANGLKAKKRSLENTLKHFDFPCVVLVQETMLKQKGKLKLDGYQVFEPEKENKGQGLLTAVRKDLDAAVVFDSEDEAEILVVQTQVGDMSIRVCNAYGPQESTLTDATKLSFLQQLEK